MVPYLVGLRVCHGHQIWVGQQTQVHSYFQLINKPSSESEMLTGLFSIANMGDPNSEMISVLLGKSVKVILDMITIYQMELLMVQMNLLPTWLAPLSSKSRKWKFSN